MNKKTLQKLIDELDKETPRLDYIRGVIETIIESLPEEPKYTHPQDVAGRILPMVVPHETIVSEDRLSEIKRMAGE